MQPTVKAYTLSTCSHCKRAKDLLRQLGVQFEYTDVDLLSGTEKDAVIAEVRKINPMVNFPTIIIGDKVIVGANEFAIRDALGMGLR